MFIGSANLGFIGFNEKYITRYFNYKIGIYNVRFMDLNKLDFK